MWVTSDFSSEIKINGDKCKKLGTLSNGNEKQFEVDDCPLKLFVSMKEKNGEDIVLEEISIENDYNDIYLSGKIEKRISKRYIFALENQIYSDFSEKRHEKRMRGLILVTASALLVLTVVFAFFLKLNDGFNLSKISKEEIAEISDSNKRNEDRNVLESETETPEFFAD